MSETDKIWMQDPVILFKKYLSFIPRKEMTNNQFYNAITRFCIYFIILILIFNKPKAWLYLPLFIIALIILSYSINLNKKENFNNVIETNPLDSETSIQFKRTTGERLEKDDLSYACRPPTNDNPFMNPAVSDYNTNVPSACNTDDEDIKNEIKRTFNYNLYMDIDDVFEKVNSQRQFYTVPNTSIPSNQEDIANWLYRVPETCKQDQEQCLRYEDLRFKR